MKSFNIKTIHKRIIIAILCMGIILSLSPIITFADGDGDEYYTHTHTSDCYPEGATQHKHTDACYADASQHDCGGSIEWTEIGSADTKCPKCGATIKIHYYSGKSTGCGRKFTSTVHDRCASCGYKITQINSNELVSYPQNKCKYNTGKKGLYQLVCGKEAGAWYDKNGKKVQPSCSKVVVGITAKETSQHTDTPDFTLIALYLDGHTAYIQPTSTDYDSSKKYANSVIYLNYEGEIMRIGNQGKLTTVTYVTSASENYDPYMEETGDTNATVIDVDSGETVPTDNVGQQVNYSNGNDGSGTNYNTNYNTNLGDTGYNSSDINNALGTTGDRSSGSNYYTIDYSGYQNPSILNTGNSSVLGNDTPTVGMSNEAADAQSQYEYKSRKPVDVVLTTQKDMTPSSNYGVLKFTENVRHELNDTIGNHPKEEPTTQQGKEEPTTQQEQGPNTQKRNSSLLLILIFVVFAIILGIIVLCIKFFKNKSFGRNNKNNTDQMNLSDRLNM